jgi:hypothetical protein
VNPFRKLSWLLAVLVLACFVMVAWAGRGWGSITQGVYPAPAASIALGCAAGIVLNAYLDAYPGNRITNSLWFRVPCDILIPMCFESISEIMGTTDVEPTPWDCERNAVYGGLGGFLGGTLYDNFLGGKLWRKHE